MPSGRNGETPFVCHCILEVSGGGIYGFGTCLQQDVFLRLSLIIEIKLMGTRSF